MPEPQNNMTTNGKPVLVESASQPGTYHRVVNGVCDCKGFYYRGYCRHVKLVGGDA